MSESQDQAVQFEHASREGFFAKATERKLATEAVPFPELGMVITFRALRGTEVDTYQKSRVAAVGDRQEYDTSRSRAQLFSLGAINEDGSKMFNTKGDIDKLNLIDNVILERGAEVVSRLSGLKNGAVKAAGESSGGDPTVNSSSD